MSHIRALITMVALIAAIITPSPALAGERIDAAKAKIAETAEKVKAAGSAAKGAAKTGWEVGKGAYDAKKAVDREGGTANWFFSKIFGFFGNYPVLVLWGFMILAAGLLLDRRDLGWKQLAVSQVVVLAIAVAIHINAEDPVTLNISCGVAFVLFLVLLLTQKGRLAEFPEGSRWYCFWNGRKPPQSTTPAEDEDEDEDDEDEDPVAPALARCPQCGQNTLGLWGCGAGCGHTQAPQPPPAPPAPPATTTPAAQPTARGAIRRPPRPLGRR